MANLPAVVDYAIKLYDKLASQAKQNEYHELIFTGSVVDAYKEVGASLSYYSPIRKLLVESGSVEFMVRGTGKQQSQVKLNGAPEVEQLIFAEGLTRGVRAATLTAEVERRLQSLEAWRETTGGINIGEALRNMEQRLSKLEGTES